MAGAKKTTAKSAVKKVSSGAAKKTTAVTTKKTTAKSAVKKVSSGATKKTMAILTCCRSKPSTLK